jgi:hypothetical protein
LVLCFYVVLDYVVIDCGTDIVGGKFGDFELGPAEGSSKMIFRIHDHPLSGDN